MPATCGRTHGVRQRSTLVATLEPFRGFAAHVKREEVADRQSDPSVTPRENKTPLYEDLPYAITTVSQRCAPWQLSEISLIFASEPLLRAHDLSDDLYRLRDKHRCMPMRRHES